MSAEFSGALDQRVTLQRQAAGRDDIGTPDGGWTTTATVWAALAPKAAAGWGQGDRPAAAPRWTMTLRAGAEVTAGDRVGWRGLTFAVRDVSADPAMPDRLTLTLQELP